MHFTDLELGGQTRQIVRGTVVAVADDGTVSVRCAGGSAPLRCAVLNGDDGGRPAVGPGDTVLLWCGDDGPGVILGRVGPAAASRAVPAVAGPVSTPASPPEELVIEATQQLTFKCGDGSITLRGDGKILIKGQDLVSYARRMNRIKGGAVAIN